MDTNKSNAENIPRFMQPGYFNQIRSPDETMADVAEFQQYMARQAEAANKKQELVLLEDKYRKERERLEQARNLEAKARARRQETNPDRELRNRLYEAGKKDGFAHCHFGLSYWKSRWAEQGLKEFSLLTPADNLVWAEIYQRGWRHGWELGRGKR